MHRNGSLYVAAVETGERVCSKYVSISPETILCVVTPGLWHRPENGLAQIKKTGLGEKRTLPGAQLRMMGIADWTRKPEASSKRIWLDKGGGGKLVFPGLN